MQNTKNKGMNMLEVIIVISIITIITAVTIPSLSSFKKQQALKNTTEDIVSLLNEARNSTISSKNSTTYGIHFEEDKATLFPGAIFIDSTLNKQINFDQAVIISLDDGINLHEGGDDLVFERITGNTTDYGTIIVQLVSDASKLKTITISSIGIISVN